MSAHKVSLRAQHPAWATPQQGGPRRRGTDLLHNLSIGMEPEDGVIRVYGLGEDSVTAFTDEGVEELKTLPRERVDRIAVECVAELAEFLDLQKKLI